MPTYQSLPLVIAGLVLASVISPDGSASAADDKHIAQLRETNSCVGCDLSGADLTGSSALRPDLSGANLSRTKLSKSTLFEARLSGAFLFEADLFESDLAKADLTKANLSGANLSRTNLSGAKLSEAILSRANLTRANLTDADLTKASLSGATLSGGNLQGADLTGADLSGSKLDSTNLSGVNLSGAILTWAELARARFEPIAIPPGRSFRFAKGLDALLWHLEPEGMILLRNALKDAGMRQQEREVIYAQLKSQRIKTGGLEGALQYVLLEATSDWGMSPARPFWIMLGLIPLFALFYLLPVAWPSPKGAVWRIWDKDRAQKDQGQDEPEQMMVSGHRLPLYALFFSVLSAFHIGWRELNVGSWIARLNPYEFTLKGTGWVRTVSGIQSLISVYLLALAVLTYFGRPFE